MPLELIPHLRRVREHIDRHFADPIDLDQLADLAGISRHHLVRSFGAVYGEPPMRYATRRRIERAQDDLAARPRATGGKLTSFGTYAPFSYELERQRVLGWFSR